eukprot:10024851-Prorocentrum_lima.AAC.1
MTSSLVGSEMCIRDRRSRKDWSLRRLLGCPLIGCCGVTWRGWVELPVSYTHLTLPTICSV